MSTFVSILTIEGVLFGSEAWIRAQVLAQHLYKFIVMDTYCRSHISPCME